ncbi:hypothetical protein [Deinococcus aerophilus]|uniref:Uncharacterized protein n=1 Tax=Deinococcus aerophilus TaxID=522488 RepID=A0ABQ2H053_9DEIO|nr:hypothetical protein [Deinococcus aerophilus]GGM19860.1 hypothetical protein GCM10010841_29820 [Deinococcus aerophilus]
MNSAKLTDAPSRPHLTGGPVRPVPATAPANLRLEPTTSSAHIGRPKRPRLSQRPAQVRLEPPAEFEVRYFPERDEWRTVLVGRPRLS